MQIEITESQVSYIKSLDSKKKQRKFLLNCLVEQITSIGKSVKISKMPIIIETDGKGNYYGTSIPEQMLQKHISDVERFIENKLTESFLVLANRAVEDETLSLETCQDLKNQSVKYKQHELASKFRQKEKDILDTFSREKLYELVQNGTIQISDMIHTENRKTEKLFPKPEGERIDMENILQQDELLKFDVLENAKRNWTVFEVIKESDYFKDMLENCFKESRLTHPMIGFKHDSFASYLDSLS